MTPEQEDWYQYGQARLRLVFARTCCSRAQRREFAAEAWRKRSACKRWVMPANRKCKNCELLLRPNDYEPCDSCLDNPCRPFWRPNKKK